MNNNLKNNMRNMGFNNFKPFGEKMQNFSKKPITLIYGPNSIGKSSFIHMAAYIRYIKESKNLDLKNTDMFGDNINLGGFDKFIHKRDKENVVSLEFQFVNCSDAIIEYLDIQELSKRELDALLTFSTSDLENIIKDFELYIFNNQSNEFLEEEIIEIPLKRTENNYINKNSDKILDLTDIEVRNKFISNILIPFCINKAKSQYSIENKFHNLILDDQGISKLAKITSSLISKLLSENEYLIRLRSSILPLKIVAEIKYSHILKRPHFQKVKYYIDNTLFDVIEEGYECGYEGGSEFSKFGRSINRSWLSVFSENPEIFNNMPDDLKLDIYPEEENTGIYSKFRENRKHEKNYDILFLSFKNGYHNLIGVFNDMIEFDKMQYIGPLRFYPERDSDLSEFSNNTSNIPNSQTSWIYLKKDEKLRSTINEWFKNPNKLKTPYEIKYRKLYDMKGLFKNIDFDTSYEDLINEYFNFNSKDEFDILSFLTPIDLPDRIMISNNTEFYYKDKELSKNQLFSWLIQVMLEKTDSKEELIFEDLRNGTQISNRDLGLGISQVLPILIATNQQKNMTIAIEQPELHLHPAVQCEIADEFIRSYKKNGNNFIIETHSEHLLLRIMKRMRYTSENRENRDKNLDLTPDDICLIYIDSNNDKTYINELELDEDGTLLDPWPNGFFEEGSKERFD